MSISNEVCYEVATAMLARAGKSPQELSRMKEIVFNVQATLQRLDRDNRRRRVGKVREDGPRALRGSAEP